MAADGHKFEPTILYLANALARARAFPSAGEAETQLRQLGAAIGVNANGGPLAVGDFLQLCERLKQRGGVAQFVATMAASAAHLYGGTLTNNGPVRREA